MSGAAREGGAVDVLIVRDVQLARVPDRLRVLERNARDAFDETGLIEVKAREIVARQLAAFATWIERVRIREAGLS